MDATLQTLMDKYGEFPAWAIKEWVEFCFYCCSWINNEYSSMVVYIYVYVTRKAKTRLMALAIFDRRSIFNSLLRSYL